MTPQLQTPRRFETSFYHLSALLGQLTPEKRAAFDALKVPEKTAVDMRNAVWQTVGLSRVPMDEAVYFLARVESADSFNALPVAVQQTFLLFITDLAKEDEGPPKSSV